MAASQAVVDWQWENAAAGSVAGLASVTFSHPLDVVRTRFQVDDGRNPHLPSYKNTRHALFTIARSEGLRGLYAGFYPAVLGSTISWGLYFYFYSKAKQRYLKNRGKLTPGLHLASAAEAGGLVCVLTNPVWLVKTRLQLQTPEHQTRYSGFNGASSKLAAILVTYPFQVIRARLQQRPGINGVPRYMDGWQVIKRTARLEGLNGFYKGITANILKNLPSSSLTFVVYENMLNMLKLARAKE